MGVQGFEPQVWGTFQSGQDGSWMVVMVMVDGGDDDGGG